MSLSCSQYRRRSLPLTSALLPIDTKLDSPIPRRRASSNTAMPSPPDWEAKATRPRSGGTGAKVAFIDTVGSVLMMPMQFGPTRRIPAARARLTNSSWTARPSPPDSAKPAEITTRVLIPLDPHSSIAR